MSDDYDFSECDRFFEQIEPTINYGAHDDPVDVAYKFVRACYRLLRPENVDWTFKELKQRLRNSEVLHLSKLTIVREAANTIRQQAERIAELQIALGKSLANGWQLEIKLSAAQQRLERWEWLLEETLVQMGRDGANMDTTHKYRRLWLKIRDQIARLPDDEGEKT